MPSHSFWITALRLAYAIGGCDDHFSAGAPQIPLVLAVHMAQLGIPPPAAAGAGAAATSRTMLPQAARCSRFSRRGLPRWRRRQPCSRCVLGWAGLGWLEGGAEVQACGVAEFAALSSALCEGAALSSAGGAACGAAGGRDGGCPSSICAVGQEGQEEKEGWQQRRQQASRKASGGSRSSTSSR